MQGETPDNLSVRHDVRGSTLEVRLAGELDMAAAFKFETQLDALIGADEVERVVLDLGRLGFVDSAGLGALLAVRDRAKELDVDLTVSRVSDSVQRILDLTGLDQIVDD